MKLSSSVELRRCRPLLGTYVEITVKHSTVDRAATAIDRAFATIERIEKQMSAHDGESELSRINRDAHRCAVRVSKATFKVLRRGCEFSRLSGGAFDFTVAPILAKWGYLPAALRRTESGNWEDVVLLSNQRVRFQSPLAIDLGGIAKGYAVDAAIISARRAGAHSAVVNAGGDLRAMGTGHLNVALRHPAGGATTGHVIELNDQAVATSSPIFTQRRYRGKITSHLVNPDQRSAVTGSIAVSVRASECWVADALTKVILNAPESLSGELLRRFNAEAFVLQA